MSSSPDEKVPARPPPWWTRETALALCGYAIMLGVSWACGWRMLIPDWTYQLLDFERLSEAPWQSLFYLHSQPPMMNFLAVVTMKLGSAILVGQAPVILLLHLGVGAVVIIAFDYLARVFIPPPGPRAVCLVMWIIHPVFYMKFFFFFYTLYELAFVLMICCCAHRYFAAGRTRDFAAACLFVTLLVLTRSLFHFAWAFFLIAWLLVPIPFRASPWSRPSRGHLSIALASAAVMLLWPAKNAVVFGAFTYSTWQGYNLGRSLPIEPETVPKDLEHIPERFRDVPTLTEWKKSDGTENWNHYALIEEFRGHQRLALDVMKREPWRVAVKAVRNYWHLTRFAGRHPYGGTLGDIRRLPPDRARPWLRIYEIIVFQEFRNSTTLAHRTLRRVAGKPWHINGFLLSLPIILVAAALKTRRLRLEDTPKAATAFLMLGVITWVMAMIMFVDGIEGNRMRFPTEPLVLILAFWVLPRRLGGEGLGTI